MRVSINNLQEIMTKQFTPLIRFSVTVMDDNGEPLWTSKGWRLSWDQAVLPPASGYQVWHQVTEKFEDMLRTALKGFPGVRKMLEAHNEAQTVKSIPVDELLGVREL
jgi:hypothetical protein